MLYRLNQTFNICFFKNYNRWRYRLYTVFLLNNFIKNNLNTFSLLNMRLGRSCHHLPLLFFLFGNPCAGPSLFMLVISPSSVFCYSVKLTCQIILRSLLGNQNSIPSDQSNILLKESVITQTIWIKIIRRQVKYTELRNH